MRPTRIITRDAFIGTSLSTCLLHTVGNRHDDVDLANLRDLRLHIANDGAVATFDDCGRVKSLDLEEGVVEVLEIAVDELCRVRPALYDDALRKEIVQRGCRRRTGNSRDRIRDNGLVALP